MSCGGAAGADARTDDASTDANWTDANWTDDPWDAPRDNPWGEPWDHPELDAAPPPVDPAPRCWDEIPIEMLGHVVWTVDAAGLSDDEAIGFLRAQQRLVNHQMALRARMIVDATDRSEGDAPGAVWGEFAALEAGTALTLTRRAAESEVELAFAVVRRLPDVWGLLHAGLIDWSRARVMVRGVEHILDDDQARAIIATVADAAHRLTTGQLTVRIRRACLDADAADAVRRYERSIEDRRVIGIPNNDGTGDLLAANLPPDRLNEALDHVDAMARRLPDGRTIDQKRADVLLDLLSGRCVHGHSPAGTSLQVTVDLETLIGLAEHPADLDGWGPVVADIARQALEEVDGGMRVRVADADASVDLSLRRPTAAQRRRVRHRHPTCVFPGCRMPAARSDIDHTRRHSDGGPTATTNLAPLCRFHHRAKDEGGWRYAVDPDGTVVWVSPAGLTYTVDRRGP